MKFKFLTLALLAMLFTACKPTPEGGDENNPNNGDVENSYIAISLAAANDRGDDDYVIGEAAERLVNSVHVFFFTDGEPFTGVTNPRNYQAIPIGDNIGDDMPNISDIHESVLVIEGHDGQLPNQMVAVINWQPSDDTYSLEDLKDELVGHINANGTFVMSNSVYKNEAGLVYATPLDITNFYTSGDDAKANPVKVYVERVAAKVIVKANDTEDHKFLLRTSKTDDSPIVINGKNVYAKIIGWDLYNSYAESNLVKNIEDYTIGINWNDPNNFRSYWATCNGNAALVNEVDYDALNEYYTHLYCGENTRGNLDADASLRTKIFFKAQLQDEDGGAIEVARWFGNDYVGEENLLKAVKSTISNTYYYGLVADGVTTYKSIEDTDLKTVAGGDGDGGSVKAYQVYFQLSDQGTAKSWYKLVNGEFVDVTATLNGELKTYISPALLYKEGQTYYYTDIEHLKSASATTYGVVRNHIYDVTVKTISGLGTPVADEDITIEVPETPAEDAKTYLAAEINILSWRLVSNDVDL